MATFYDPSSHCADCNESNVQWPLTCWVHFICDKCTLKRIQEAPSSQCRLCRDLADTDTLVTKREQIKAFWIYVDDSNIWIEAKKLASKMRRFKTKEDHIVRIDFGKLTEVVANGRPVAQGFLYGSEPPPVDTVWNKIREEGWNVTKHRGSRITGKEKKMTTRQLVVDITETVCTTPPKERSTFVIITGDVNAIPAINVALEYEWNVEVVLWKHETSAKHKEMEKKWEKRLKLRYLDDFLEKVIFTNRKFQISGNDHLIPDLKQSGIVLRVDDKKFPRWVPTTNWFRKVEAIAQWPFHEMERKFLT
uniref:NYN domain-containing protein n=1 Tax=Amphimedon queenslandica TaxID=400682 RepID=A0A1X7TZ29_AMPQE